MKHCLLSSNLLSAFATAGCTPEGEGAYWGTERPLSSQPLMKISEEMYRCTAMSEKKY